MDWFTEAMRLQEENKQLRADTARMFDDIELNVSKIVAGRGVDQPQKLQGKLNYYKGILVKGE